MTDQLFDPDLFPSKADKERKQSKPKEATPTHVEPWVEPWVLISTRKGVIPFHHLPVNPAKLEAAVKAGLISGATLVECGAFGNPIHLTVSGVTNMIRCPDCSA